MSHATAAAGDLLISHPYWSDEQRVCLITEHTAHSSLALELNTPAEVTFAELVMEKGISVGLNDRVYTGGDYNTHALVMLHDCDWYSSNTMQVDENWSISSDYHMIDKLAMGNLPTEFRVMLGITAWGKGDLDHELASAKSPWLLLQNPYPGLVMCEPDDQYELAFKQFTKQCVSHFFD